MYNQTQAIVHDLIIEGFLVYKIATLAEAGLPFFVWLPFDEPLRKIYGSQNPSLWRWSPYSKRYDDVGYGSTPRLTLNRRTDKSKIKGEAVDHSCQGD